MSIWSWVNHSHKDITHKQWEDSEGCENKYKTHNHSVIWSNGHESINILPIPGKAKIVSVKVAPVITLTDRCWDSWNQGNHSVFENVFIRNFLFWQPFGTCKTNEILWLQVNHVTTNPNRKTWCWQETENNRWQDVWNASSPAPKIGKESGRPISEPIKRMI